MTIPTVPEFTGPLPQRSGQTQAEFSNNVDQLFQDLPDVVDGWNDSIDAVNSELPVIAQSAEAAAAALGAANYKGEWSTLTGALAIPASVSHNGSVWLLTEDVPDVTAVEPGISPVWIDLIPEVPASTSARITARADFTGLLAANYEVNGGAQLTDGRYFLVLSSSTRAYGVVYDEEGDSFGDPALIRTADIRQSVSVIANGADQILVATVTHESTAAQIVACDLSGTSITVGTAATFTVGANVGTKQVAILGGGGQFISCAGNRARAFTVTGSTIATGSEITLTGNSFSAVDTTSTDGLFAVFTEDTSGNKTLTPVTVSGTGITAGTAASASSSNETGVQVRRLLTGRWAMVHLNNGKLGGAIASISGTTATISAVALNSTSTVSTLTSATAFGSYVICIASGSSTAVAINILTDNAGTANAGTPIETIVKNVARLVYFGSSEDAVYFISQREAGLNNPELFKVLNDSGNPEAFISDYYSQTNFRSASWGVVGANSDQDGNRNFNQNVLSLIYNEETSGYFVPQETAQTLVRHGDKLFVESALVLPDGFYRHHQASDQGWTISRSTSRNHVLVRVSL
jgi:hypothetical protein